MISRFFFKKMLSQQFIVKVFSILFEIENIEKKQEKKTKNKFFDSTRTRR